ncbi:MAG TPA: PilZ domain-containing protein [Gemmataceae bacterium]|nr:PilZ domain-containing protein [Gemmataceae bacterium]
MSDQTDSSAAIPPHQSPTPNRRVAVRHSCTLKSLCQTKSARPEDFWWWGKIQDISTGGIALVIRRPFELGTLLVIEPLAGQESFQPLQVRVVRTSKRDGGGWLLGCEFTSLSDGQSEAIAHLLPASPSPDVLDGLDVL